jgi:uncharacterized protein
MSRYLRPFLLIIFTSLLALQAFSIPQKRNPPRLVNDYTGMLNGEDFATLEQKLVAFNDSTSTQIAIVIVSDFEGYDKATYAYMIGENWGVGQKGKNNGVILLVKPKTLEARGEVFIAPGYGLEGALPDAVCKRIIENEIIPRFKQRDYFGGIDAAVTIIMSLTRGEYTADNYMKKSQKKMSKNGVSFIVILILFIIFFIIPGSRSNRKNHTISSGSSIPFWLLMSGLGSSGRSSGGWGDFSSGGGSFGGFGGGSFGGGGAGGSW